MALLFVASFSLVAGITIENRGRNFLTREGTYLGTEVSAEVHQDLQSLAETLLSPDSVEGQASLHQSLRSIQGKMDPRTAAKAIANRNFPAGVSALVRTVAEGKQEPNLGFDEASMSKARIALNDLVEKAWQELDNKIIECKEYQEMNRGTFDQVTTDISRLVEQITDLERVETESLEGISKMEMEIAAVEAEISKETKIYNYNWAKK
jgi:hypothetical protein